MPRPGRAAWPLLQIECRHSTISPLRIEIGLDLDRHRRSKRRMRHLVGARPLHAHRPAAGGLRQQHSVERDIVGGVVAVAAGAFEMLDRDVLRRQFQDQREIVAQEIDALAVGPDMDAVLAVPLRHRAGGRDRRMRNVGADILPAQRARLLTGARGCPRVDDGQFHRLRLQECREIVFIRQRVAFRPGRALAQRIERHLGAGLGLADHAGKVAVTHDCNETWDSARRVLLQCNQPCARNLRVAAPGHATARATRCHE